MAKLHGVAGEWARVKGMVLGLWPLFLGVFSAGFATAFIIVNPLWGGSVLVVSLLFILWSLIRGLRHVERFFKGARGEERVSGILKQLPDSYHIFNDFAFGRRHVDHVVVGPGGIFAVETKFWRGTVTVEENRVLLDGQLPDRDPLNQALREANIVRSKLNECGWKGAVTPVLTFASDTFTAHRAVVRGVSILNSNELKESFATDRVVLSNEEIDRLVGLMESL